MESPVGVRDCPTSLAPHNKPKSVKRAVFIKPGDTTAMIMETFTLPMNFPLHVESALVEESMTSRPFAAFITTIARAVFAVKCYPSATEYIMLLPS
jgi:hypothetical protein